MKTIQPIILAVSGILLLGSSSGNAQDWTQWRGDHRDGMAANFQAPEQWPAELVKHWTVEVGNGVASPSVKGDKVYVMALQDGNEVMRCLDAATGDEVWRDEYKARAASGPAGGFAGTRSSPAIADGYVVALGVNGTVSCWDAESGKLEWRNDDHLGQIPRFSTSSSPLIAEGLCILQFGSEEDGGIVGYDLKSGKQKWQWNESGSSYASPVLMKVGNQNIVLAAAATQLAAVGVEDGKSVWSMEYTQGRYNAATPVVDGSTVYLAGPNRGVTAFKLVEQGDKIVSNDLWRNEDTETTVQYNSPVLFQGNLYGLSNSNLLFCINAETGETAWNNAFPGADVQAVPPTQRGGEPGKGGDSKRGGNPTPDANRPQRGGGRQRGGFSRRGGGGGGGYGSIVSTSSVLLGLTPKSELVIYRPSNSEFSELARYKVAETPTYAYPVLVGDRIYVKDENSLTMWTVK